MPIFLFTDIEGSTKKWEEFPHEMKKVLPMHDQIIRSVVERHGGTVIKHTGDGIFAVFEAGRPLHCALDIQRELADHDWGSVSELRVRIGLHAGLSEKRGDDYFGPVINRTARVMAAAWGGQIILTPAVSHAAEMPENATLKDLGTHVLKDLGDPQHLYQLVHADLKLHDFPSLRSLSAHSHNLPVQSTPFVGRESELAEVTKLLADRSCRLLTLIGPGGSGKTRLALQAAAEKIEYFKQGVYFTQLAPLSSVDFLIATIASVLGFSFYSKEDEKTQLLNYLMEKEMLIIMDGFEHLIDGAGIIADILNTALHVKILVTSRELLNLKGEWVFQVEGMEVPASERIDIEGFSAVQLFLYNARRVNADVDFTNKDRSYVLRICQLVGGLPLGIELATAWLRTLSCRDIAKEIEKNLDFLATRMRDIPERHRSLRAVFEYSWGLLQDDEKAALRRLSIFPGEFTREAAEKVSDTSLSLLSTLVDKSLLRRNQTGRYEMLEILRQYADQKLADNKEEKASIRSKHSSYYLEYLSAKEEALLGFNQGDAISDLMIEIKNVRQAWEWAVEKHAVEEIGKAVIAFAELHDFQNWYREGEQALGHACESLRNRIAEHERIHYGRVLSRYAGVCCRLGFYEKAQDCLDESLKIARENNDKREIIFALNYVGYINVMLWKYDEAKPYYSESLEIAREIDHTRSIVGALNNLGVTHYHLREYDEARKYLQEDLEICKKVGFQRGIAMAVANLGLIAFDCGDCEEARLLMLQSYEIDERIGNRLHTANSLHNLGLIHKAMKEYNEAKRFYEEALALRREIGDRMGIAISYNNLGNLAALRKDYRKALELHKESFAVRKELNDRRGMVQSLTNLIPAYHELGDSAAAFHTFLKALEMSVEEKAQSFLIDVFVIAINLLRTMRKDETLMAVLLYLRNYDRLDQEDTDEVNRTFTSLKKTFDPDLFAKLQEEIKKKTCFDIAQTIMKGEQR